MKIAVDGIRLSRKPSGVTFILLSIIKQLAIERPDFEIVVVLRDEIHPLLKDFLVEKNITQLVKPLPFFKNVGLFWSYFKLNRVVSELKPDYFFSPNTYLYPFYMDEKVKNIVFVHDLVFKTWPQTMSFLNKVQMWLLFKFSIKNADIIWCNSNYTKSELFEYYPGLAAKKQIFVGAGINSDFEEIANNFTAKTDFYVANSDKPYLFFVGTFEPRKNIMLLLQIFKHVAHRYDLVIVGGDGWGDTTQSVTELINSEGYPISQVKILKGVTSDKLVTLYKNAAMYITTSFNEGLGLPLLEAMFCGCPIVVAHNSAMIEVAKNAGVTVKSWDVDDWISAIEYVDANRTQLVNTGYNKVLKYQWKTVIKSFISFLKQ